MSHNNQYATPPAGTSLASNNNMRMAHRNPGAPPPASAAGAPTASNINNGNSHLINQLVEDRMGQILDDADHKRCSEGNQRALFADKLENLRLLTKELEKDEWMYAPKKAHNGLTLSNMRTRTGDPF